MLKHIEESALGFDHVRHGQDFVLETGIRARGNDLVLLVLVHILLLDVVRVVIASHPFHPIDLILHLLEFFELPFHFFALLALEAEEAPLADGLFFETGVRIDRAELAIDGIVLVIGMGHILETFSDDERIVTEQNGL